MQGCLSVPGPPNCRMLRQKRHVPQFCDWQPAHMPQRFERLPGPGILWRGREREAAEEREAQSRSFCGGAEKLLASGADLRFLSLL